ncbi:MAG: hypothetical protein EP340_09215 [Alphaproteobacteria bacterium]|nr:MAG: hypothetical protein EP340_09215 [Alphaproteobacteria bacterium]
MSYPDDQQVADWLDEERGSLNRMFDWIFYIFYQKIPHSLSWQWSLKSIILGIVRFSVFAAVTGSPVWLVLLMGQKVVPTSLISPFLILVGLVSFSKFLNFLARGRRSAELRDREETSISTSHFKAIDLISANGLSVSARVKDQSSLERAIPELLKCIESRTRLSIGREGSDYLEVTLITFEGADGLEALIRERSSSIRKINKRIPSQELLSYHVVKNGLTKKVIHDFKRQKLFPYEGATGRGAAPPYRSIMILPLPERILEGSSDRCIRGVITIDGAKPYDFWGELEDAIEIQVRPFVKLIDVLLTNHACGVKI